jgi:hypothetical protein
VSFEECADSRPHRPHLDDGPRGLCAGVPKPADLEYAKSMVREAWERATARCLGSRRPCVTCVGGELLDLEVFRPVLFPEDSK